MCGMLLLAFPGAWAQALRVDAMRLSPDASWQRGDAAREKEDGVYLLEWPTNQGVALQVALPHQSTPLKTDAEVFAAHLRKIWAAQYGKRAEIGEIEIAGVRWLACRRPTGEGDAVAFHLATVYEGRAYSLLALAPPRAVGLPRPVYDLLAGAGFGREPLRWAASRVMAAQPGREALEALVHGDAERLGQDGMLTGYGVEYRQLAETTDVQAGPGSRLAWFMEGFRWHRREGRDERLPISLRGQLEARVPARAAGGLALSLNVAAESISGVVVEVGLLDLCAPAAELDAALSRLQRGARAALDRLARDRPADCPALPEAVPSVVLPGRPGKTVVETLAFPMPPSPPLAAGLARLRIIAVRPRLAAGEDELGQGLLHRLGLYFVYAPE